MKKTTVVASLVLILIVLTTSFASAGYIFQDPIFKLGNRIVHVDIAFDEGYLERVGGKTVVTMYAPRNMDARILDPQDCDTYLVRTPPQAGQTRVSTAVVEVPVAAGSDPFPILVIVFDDLGYYDEIPGMAGEPVQVSYVQVMGR